MPAVPSPLDYQSNPAPVADERANRRAMGIVWLVIFSDLLGFGVIIPSLPLYAEQYKASPIEVGLLFSLYSVCQFIAAPFLGLASDRFGRRPVLAISQLGTVAGYVLLGWTMIHQWHSASLALIAIYISRIIDGVSGGNITTAQAYIGDISTPANRAARMGMMGAAFGLGFALGPMLGALTLFAHPAGPAFFAAALSGVACALTIALLPESHKPGTPGQDEVSWLHPSRFLPVLRNPVMGQLVTLSGAAMLAFVMLEVVFALYLTHVFGFGPKGVNGFFAMVGAIIVIVQGGLIGKLTKRFGEWPLTITGPLVAAGAQVLYAVAAFEPFVAILIVASFFNAVGRSIWFPALNSLVSRTAGRAAQGVTFGVQGAFMSLARVIGPLIAGFVYQMHVTGPFIVAGVILVLVGGWTLALRARVLAEAVQPATAEAPA